MSKELKAWFTVDELNAWADKKLKENPQWAEQPAPVAWMEMVVANLVREGVNKHKARELAQHFYASPPAQRTWVGLTNNELQPIADEYRILFGSWVEDFARAIEAKLRSKNNG